MAIEDSLENADTFDYDNAGDKTTREKDGTEWTQTFSADNRLEEITDGTDTWFFTYDSAPNPDLTKDVLSRPWYLPAGCGRGIVGSGRTIQENPTAGSTKGRSCRRHDNSLPVRRVV